MAISATFQATCSGNLYWVEAYENYDLDATGECTTLSPIFVNPNVYGSKTFSASGWLLPCSTPPAHFVSPDEFEFQYRKSGNTTWITPSWSPSGYTSGPERVDVAETGIYQYRWRNKGTSPAACTGPYWDAFYTTSYPSVNVSY